MSEDRSEDRAAASSAAHPSAALPPPETVVVSAHRVACDGPGPALGHPRVWLEIGARGWVDCPYCDRRFKLDAAH